ncbi:GNAT family N-acetyltransferase [Fodinicola feengrottensis]|uniref:GNAT family N-acetyltransferase n=1 Tax=Fodinicola feengrottensis TaxID=435914 RepID=UPI0028BF05F4|nr:GNAT family N-acetyltransferase [Fodinicola feengrottensis]
MRWHRVFLRIYTAPDRGHLVLLEGAVHPAARRTGVGTQLLETALGHARTTGAKIVLSDVEADTSGATFLVNKGFRPVLTLVHTRLSLTEVDIAALVEKPHPGYRLVSWEGVAPDGLAESLAGAHNAMNDMPVGDSGRKARRSGGTPNGCARSRKRWPTAARFCTP